MNRKAYTLVEVLIAAAVLVVGVAAAGFLALAMIAQEEMNVRVSRSLNHHEQAARLFQLGLSPSEISALLPAEPSVLSLDFNVELEDVAGVGEIELATSTMTYEVVQGGVTWDPLGSAPERESEIIVIRPTIR